MGNEMIECLITLVLRLPSGGIGREETCRHVLYNESQSRVDDLFLIDTINNEMITC